MLIKALIAATLLVLSGFFKAQMDLSAEGRLSPPELNKSNSWRNKWKLGPDGEPLKDANGDPIELYWGSSRWFVGLTDFWHSRQTLFLWCWTAAFALLVQQSTLQFFLIFIAIRGLQSGTFQIVYQSLKRKRHG